MDTAEAIHLADYRRRVHEMYARVRAGSDGEAAWHEWRVDRDQLFKDHPSTAIEPTRREAFTGLHYFPYDPRYRFEVSLMPLSSRPVAVAHSGEGCTSFVPIGSVSLGDIGVDETLTVYWLEAYGGGLFLPFRDATAAESTYGGGRYLLDTVKGADLGGTSPRLLLDFNYAYHPSCVYSTRWSCPLAPEANRLSAGIPTGERLASQVG